MRAIPAIWVLLVTVVTLAHAGRSDVNLVWKGQCERKDKVKPPAAVTLTIHAYPGTPTGTLNGQPIANLDYPGTPGAVGFDSSGFFKDEPVVRTFDGRLNPDGRISGYLKQPGVPDKVAECNFSPA